MRAARYIFCLLQAACLLVACLHDEIVETPDAAGNISLHASSVELMPEGTASIAFTTGDCDPLASDCLTELRLRDGSEPQLFEITEIAKGEAPGVFVLTLTDRGLADAYSREVCVVITNGGSISIKSDYICVNCGPAAFPPVPETGLPVVCIDTADGLEIENKSTERQAVMRIRGIDGLPGLRPVSCELKGHGNTSWAWDKKPYRISLRDDVPLLGMPPGRNWILLANFPDRTLMRNMVAMRVSSLTSLDWTPRCVPVELVLNGSHRGSYLLIERVEAAPDRVNVPDGFLLELDFHYDNKRQWIDPHGISRLRLGIPFAVRYPLPRDLGTGEEERIRQHIFDAAEVLYSEDFADPDKGYAAWLDVDSFVDYWIVFEVMGNPELFNPGSVYMHRATGGKLTAGPCWDFDCCLQELRTDIQERTDFLDRDAIWYARLFRDSAFAERVGERFRELLPQLKGVADYIDECGELLAPSAELNFEMWDPTVDRWQNKGLLINGDEDLEFGEAVTRLREVYLRRLELLDRVL